MTFHLLPGPIGPGERTGGPGAYPASSVRPTRAHLRMLIDRRSVRYAQAMSIQTVTPEDTQPLLSPAEAARLANVSTKTIRREIERGALPVLHAGRQLRIDPDAFRRWLEGGTE